MNMNSVVKVPFQTVERSAREIQSTREEFFRELPDALDGRAYAITGDVVTIKEGRGEIRISIRELGTRELGELELPMMEIEFSFVNLAKQEIAAFMKTCDERTLRGSGGM